MALKNIYARLRNAHPDHHAIAKGMAWVSMFVLLASLTRAGREMAIAYRYGVSAEVDAYLFVLNLVNWPIGVWFSVLTVVLVPLAARIKKDTSTDIHGFRAELFGFALLLGVVLAVAVWQGLPLLLHAKFAGLPTGTLAIATKMVPPMALLALLGAVISLFSVLILAAGKHTNTLLESIPPLVLLLVVLIFPDGGAQSLVWGTIAGFALHLVCLAVLLAWRGEIEPPRFTRHSENWRAFWQGFGIMLAGQVLMSFVGIIDQFFAAHLGTGAISILSYANRILTMILAVVATAVSRATLPVFSQRYTHEEGELHSVASHWVRFLFVLGMIATIIGWWLSPWVVKLFFERGAFTASNTLIVTKILRYGLTQLPFYFAGLVLVSYLTSRGLYTWLFWSGVIGLSCKILGNAILIPFFGIGGVAFSTAFMYAANFVFFRWVFKKSMAAV